jgi:hypothetical protein
VTAAPELRGSVTEGSVAGRSKAWDPALIAIGGAPATRTRVGWSLEISVERAVIRILSLHPIAVRDEHLRAAVGQQMKLPRSVRPGRECPVDIRDRRPGDDGHVQAQPADDGVGEVTTVVNTGNADRGEEPERAQAEG